MKSEMWVAFADAHYPRIHRPTWKCFLDFTASNPIAGVIDLGDTVDNSCISRHTAHQPGARSTGEYKMDTEGYYREMIEPLNALLKKRVRKIKLTGNHCDWEREYYLEHPNIKGLLDRTSRLKELGWEVIPFSKIFKHGKLSFTHGEFLAGKYHANSAVEKLCRNVLYGHFHTSQTMTKIVGPDQERWTATCSPIIGECNPEWMEGRPNAWVNGFNVIEYQPNGNFNLYPVITINGKASFGGRIYAGA